MYAFARQPKWIVGHVLAAVLVTSFIAAGFWQLSRHQWRADLNDRLDAREQMAPVAGDELVTGDPDELELRLVDVDGTWVDGVIVISGRSFEGQPGCHVISTLDLGDGRGVVVNRGWLDIVNCESGDPRLLEPPSDAARVAGQLRATQEPGRFQASDPADGVLTSMLRVDVERIDQQTAVDLVEVYIDQRVAVPDDGALRPVEPPPNDPGPHLGYAFQWFVFAAIGLIGYPLILRRQARDPDTADDAVPLADEDREHTDA